jgi:hypothetical protein
MFPFTLLSIRCCLCCLRKPNCAVSHFSKENVHRDVLPGKILFLNMLIKFYAGHEQENTEYRSIVVLFYCGAWGSVVVKALRC